VKSDVEAPCLQRTSHFYTDKTMHTYAGREHNTASAALQQQASAGDDYGDNDDDDDDDVCW
jgi:hypothetical protein